MVTGKPLLTTEQISHRIKELGNMISEDYEGKKLLAVGIMKGAFMFFSDLVKNIRTPLMVDFMIASSYLGTNTTEEVKIFYDIRENVSDKHVLLIEDIIDTGITIKNIKDLFLAKNPASLKICCLLDKKERRRVDIGIDYIGFEIPDKYVVGYGLDYENKFRNLPYIAILKENH